MCFHQQDRSLHVAVEVLLYFRHEGFGKAVEVGSESLAGEIREVHEDQGVETVGEQRVHIEADHPRSAVDVLPDEDRHTVHSVRDYTHDAVESIYIALGRLQKIVETYT